MYAAVYCSKIKALSLKDIGGFSERNLMKSIDVLSSRTLKRDLTVAFGLIILSGLVFLAYLFPGISFLFEIRSSLHIIVVIIVFIVTIGFIIIAQIVEPIIKISHEAQRIANGDLSREIPLLREDEIGELGKALNRMTQRMKENVDELRNFSKTTEVINNEINKRILTLSNLLQVSNLISQNADLKEIIEVGVGKCLSSGVMNLGCLIMKDLSTSEYHIYYLNGSKHDELMDKDIKDHKIKLGEGLLGKALLKQSIVVIDRETQVTSEVTELKSLLLVQNLMVVPILSKGNVYGLLIAGNDFEEFIFSNTERELLLLISKQIAIAYSNEILKKEIEKLEVMDKLTGLYNSRYLRNRLNEEIKRAVSFQRPCSFVILTIDRFNEFHEIFGHIAAENALIKIGSILKAHIGEADKAARFGDHEFALILPEKNKRQSIEVADIIRSTVELTLNEEDDPRRKITCTGAVTENPIDGVTADDLIRKAGEILKDAHKQGGNRICYKI